VQLSDGAGAKGNQVRQDMGLRLRDLERARSGQEERDPVRGAMDVRDQVKWHVDYYRILPYRNNSPTRPAHAGAPMSDRSFIRAFEQGRIAPADFHHADHLRLALAYLTDSASVAEATDRMAASLRACARAAGHEQKYHHTLTVAWVRLVARLLDQQLPLAYYSRARLFSSDARERWIEPDLQDL